MHISKDNFIPLGVTVFLFLIVFIVGSTIPEEFIKGSIEHAGPFGVLLFIFLIWLTNIIAPLGASPFLYVGFYFYGNSVVIYAFVAAVISSVTNFLIARKWGRPFVLKLAGSSTLEKVDKLTNNYGLQTLFIFRIFLKDFHDVISYAFGLTVLNFRSYLLVSTLGMIPPTILWYVVSSRITGPLTFTIISWVVAYAFLLIYILSKKFGERQRK